MEHAWHCVEIVLGLILMLGMTGGTVALGCWMLKDFVIKKKSCTSETEAEVTGYKEETSNGEDGNRTSYFCKYQYSIDGKAYQDISTIGEGSPVFAIGSKITIRYNPNNHNQHYIVGSSFSVTMIIGGGFFICMGITGFVFTCISIFNKIKHLDFFYT